MMICDEGSMSQDGSGLVMMSGCVDERIMSTSDQRWPIDELIEGMPRLS